MTDRTIPFLERPLARTAWLLITGLPIACATPGVEPAGRGPGVAVAAGESVVRIDTLAAGVVHRSFRYGEGPQSIHIVDVDPQACGIDLRTVKGRDLVVGRETTSAMAERTATATGRPALVAVNADFFNFEPPGLPEGPQVSTGAVVVGQGTARAALDDRVLRDQPVFGMTADHRAVLGSTRLEGWLRVRGAAPLRLAAANARPAADGLAVYDRWWGGETPADTGVIEVRVRLTTEPRTANDTVRSVVLGTDTAAAGVAIGAGEAVVAGRGDAATVLRTAAVGDTVEWSFSFPGLPPRIVELIGGYPMLLEDGREVHAVPDLIASFADNQHPRTAVGIRADGRIAIVVVDGRQPDHSAGMSLTELAAYLRAHSIGDVLNLDGGGSTTLVIDGRIANRPSDEAGERAVANALVVLGPEPGACGG